MRLLTTLLAALLTSCSAVQPDVRYLALGDSYTIGESVAEGERWPNQLARELGIAPPEIIARTGWTTDELNAAIDAASPRGPYQLVTLLIGVNNQYRGRDAEQYRGELDALLRRAIAFAGGDARRVIVVSIPDWGVTPFAATRDRAKIASEIDRYNAVNREVANQAGAHWSTSPPFRAAAIRTSWRATASIRRPRSTRSGRGGSFRSRGGSSDPRRACNENAFSVTSCVKERP